MGNTNNHLRANHQRKTQTEAVAELENSSTPESDKSQGASQLLVCPSFDSEPWKSRAEKLRPQSLDYYTLDLDDANLIAPPPVPLGHPYVKLLLEFLDTVPQECWIDEENDVD